jgi:hypothetical protein
MIKRESQFLRFGARIFLASLRCVSPTLVVIVVLLLAKCWKLAASHSAVDICRDGKKAYDQQQPCHDGYSRTKPRHNDHRTTPSPDHGNGTRELRAEDRCLLYHVEVPTTVGSSGATMRHTVWTMIPREPGRRGGTRDTVLSLDGRSTVLYRLHVDVLRLRDTHCGRFLAIRCWHEVTFPRPRSCPPFHSAYRISCAA